MRPPTQAAVLAALAIDGAELFHDPDGTAFAAVDVDGHREVWPVRSGSFRSWLAGGYWRLARSAPGGQAMTDALLVIESAARYDGPEHRVHLRIARHDGAVYIDLADAAWRVVMVDTTGWRILDESPVRFRRTRGMLPLPAPEPGGSLDLLRGFLNTGHDDDEDGDDRFRLLVGWLLGACRPAGPYIVLVLGGEQGSAKSTTARLLRRLVDPNLAGDRSAPRDERDLAIAASNGWIVSLDNLSRVQDWQSDALARLATGAGFATRQLFTDNEEFLVHVARPIIINGIGDLATRSDLLDRSVLVDLPRIDGATRRSEAELWRAFDRDHPRILGALLTAVSAAWSGEDRVELARPPRMADATRWIMAAEGALGWPPGAFLSAYSRNRSSAHELALDAEPFVPALRLVAASGPWQGTAAELLRALAARVGEEVTRGRDWPQSSNVLGNRLRRLAPDLRATGINVEFERDTTRNRRRVISISTEGENVVQTVRTVRPESAASDDADDADDDSPTRANGGPVLWPVRDHHDEADVEDVPAEPDGLGDAFLAADGVA